MGSRVLQVILSSAILASGSVQAEGTGIWAAYSYYTPQGSDSRVLTPESRSKPTRAVLGWSEGPHSAIVAADADFGTVRATARVTSTQSGSVNHYINSAFADEITLSRPDLAGQPGQITLSFYYEGQQTVFAGEGAYVDVSSSWLAYVNEARGDVYESTSAGEFTGHSSWTYVNDVNGIHQWQSSPEEHYLTMTADFVWGEPVLFGYTAWTSGYASGYGGHAATLMGQWGGIVAASAGGQVISDYSLSSLTGVDYSQSFVSPVPEPRFYMLMAAGLCLLAWRRSLIRP